MSLQDITGKKVAIANEQNNRDCETNIGKNSDGKIIPTSSDFEKSGLGNNRIPPTKPIIVETIAFFSLNVFE